MPANAERDELHRAIWAIADDLRGSVDGWDFKQYILGVMFYRYISEHLEKYIDKNEHDSGNTSFAYAKISDAEAEGIRDEMVNDVGFFILPSELFCNVRRKAPQDENLNETLEKVFKHIEESAAGTSSEGDFSGLFDDIDVNSNKLGATVSKRNERLAKVLNGIGDMKLEYTDSNKTDAFGDAYEYLMSMYASNAGKSGGEFFTPQEVSELLMRLATVGKTEVDGVYDPACGSGSLLLKAEEVLGKGKVHRGFFGQEINITTYNLCRINMFLHGIGFDKFSIACEDTLISPQHWDDEPFEVIVSNPPYSIKWAGDTNPLLINDPRFAPAGILAPRGKADMAFIMHALSWLKTNGTASIVCFPGIFYRTGPEQKIRKYLIENNFIDCIIQLPDNLFFGTGISTCILIMKKNKKDTNVFFIDATKEYLKFGNTNKLTKGNIKHIVDAFIDRQNIKYFTSIVSAEKIKENDYNLSVSTYVEKEDTREKIDIEKLNSEIEEVLAAEQNLKSKIKSIADGIEQHITSLLKRKNIEYLKAGEVFDTVTDYTAAGSFADIASNVKYINEPDYAMLVRTTDLKSDFLKGNFIFINEHAYDYLWRVHLDKVSLILPNIGNCGEIYYLTPEKLPYPKCALAPNSILVRSSKYNMRYLYHVLQTKDYLDQLAKITSPAGQTKFNKTDFKGILIPIPPLDVQEEIVRFLDIYIDLSLKIRNELSLRTKEYEYYRDKLLSFKGLKA